MGGKDVLDWQRGMQQSLHQKGRKNKKFGAALEQVSAGGRRCVRAYARVRTRACAGRCVQAWRCL
jgi:hypothetical protein